MTMAASDQREQDPPLHGVKVLDFTHGVAGPYTAMLLADLGAEVWKVEKPGRGDATRYMNVSRRFLGDIPASGGDYFLAINRNKKSVTIDLAADSGRQVALRLAARADLVISNFRPGVMERLGLGYDDVRAVNPACVYAVLTAYGRHGPIARQPGMDVAVQARSGVMAITGDGSGPPVKPGVSLADFGGGVHLTTAVLAALYQRERTGRGQRVDVSLLDATMSMLINYSVAVRDGGARLSAMGSGHPQLVPFQAFPSADGHVVIATGTNRLFTDLCRVLGTPGLAADPRFVSNTDRVTHRAELVELLSEITQRRTTGEWLRVFEEQQIPCAPVNTMDQALRDEQLESNGMVVEVEHPKYGTLHLLGSPYKFACQPPPDWQPPPMLGEHTRQVLSAVLGLSEQDLDELAGEHVI